MPRMFNVVSDDEVDALTDEFDPKRRGVGLRGQLHGYEHINPDDGTGRQVGVVPSSCGCAPVARISYLPALCL